MDPVVPQAEDTATQAQQIAAPAPMEIEVVDTPAAPAAAVPEAPPALIFGKYRSLEDAEKAYSEAQRVMHERSQEAATYRKMLDERAAPPPTPAYQQPPVDLDGQFRERLAENPGAVIFEAARFAANQIVQEREKSQREMVKKYQSYASQPGYADVAQQVASQLPFANENPIDPVEGVFLRARLAKLEAQLANNTTASQINPPYVEPGGMARRAGVNSMRVELDSDTAKMHISQDKMRELARIVAKQKNAGGDMRGMSIDDWEKANA